MSLPNGTSGYQLGAGNAAEPNLFPQAAPTAYTGTTVTLTAADLITGLITSTNASAVAFTLPTGALMDAAVASANLDMAFEFVIINLGSASGAVTLNAGTTFTIVGLATTAISTSSRWRVRKTADSTFVCYRVGS